jgi:hypothetical protein
MPGSPVVRSTSSTESTFATHRSSTRWAMPLTHRRSTTIRCVPGWSDVVKARNVLTCSPTAPRVSTETWIHAVP